MIWYLNAVSEWTRLECCKQSLITHDDTFCKSTSCRSCMAFPPTQGTAPFWRLERERERESHGMGIVSHYVWSPL